MKFLNQKKKIIQKLKKLKKVGVSGVKLSLEDEGSTFEDLKLMRFLTISANLDLNIKIGGCEAKNDIMFCKLLKPNSVFVVSLLLLSNVKWVIPSYFPYNVHKYYRNIVGMSLGMLLGIILGSMLGIIYLHDKMVLLSEYWMVHSMAQ